MGCRNYYPMMVEAAKSLLCYSEVDRIYFLIEDDTFPEPLPPVFRCVNVSNQTFFPEDCPNITDYYTFMTLMRSVLSKVFPKHKRVLLLDPDTVVQRDISDIWNTDISNVYFAAVRETRNHDHEKNPYFNAGVMLMNLDKFRTDGKDDQIIQGINRQKYQHLEQDVLNFFCDDKILELPQEYSYSICTDTTDNPIIKHFVSYSKCLRKKAAEKYAILSWDEVDAFRNGHFAPAPSPGHRERIVVYSGTRNVYPMMEISAKSLLTHTQVDQIFFLIEDDTFPTPLPDCIRCINVSNQHYFPSTGPNYKSVWSYMVLIRAAYPDIFKQFDSVLSIDIDTIVMKDISSIWDYDISNYYLAASSDYDNHVSGRNQDYFTCGVMLMNLKKMRDDNAWQEVVYLLNHHKYKFCEQDVFNIAFVNNFLHLPRTYNYFVNVFDDDNVMDSDIHIAHFVTGPFSKGYNVKFNIAAKPYKTKPWDDIIRIGKEE